MRDKLKIIYVDDEEMNLVLFELIFNKKYVFITAESGARALELLDSHLDTVIVISDMKMPSMSGIEFIQNAKAKFADIKYFILTGYDITNEIQQALDSNLILNYFKKPIDFNEIDSALMSALE